MNKTSTSTTANDNNDNTTVMGIRGLEQFTSRYTLKITFTAEEDTGVDCVKAIKNLFKQIKRVVDKKVFIAPWYDLDKDSCNITIASEFPSDKAELGSYFAQFFI